MDLIKVDNLVKAFGKKVVHKGVNFSVLKGECLGLIGGSGSGKSVILRSIIGLETPDAGQVVIGGVDITKLNEKELTSIRTKVAYAFQGGALFDSMTVFENLAYPLIEHTKFSMDQVKNRISEELKEFGLSGNEMLYPSSLSGGMQKRLGLARAIIMDPEVVLYDEPTAGLDPYNTRKIREMILRLKEKGVTSILVTHDMPTALVVCDRIAMLMDGKIAAIGPTNELTNQKDSVIKQFMDGEF